MAFDPDAMLATLKGAPAPAKSGGKFNPDTMLAQLAAAPVSFKMNRAAIPVAPAMPMGPGGTPVDDENGPGVVESFARGAAQGATLGFADEISGAFESLFTKKTYAQARDESRANFKAAEEANPIASLAGNVASAFIPIPGAVGAGAVKALGAGAKLVGGGEKALKLIKAVEKADTVGAAILKGAATGAVAGAGAAEENIGAGAVTGGLIGGALSGVVKKGIDSFSKKLPQKIVENATDGAKAGAMRDKVAGLESRTGNVFKVVMDKDAGKLRNALGIEGTGLAKGRNPEAIAEAADDLITKASTSNAANYTAFDKATGGVKTKNLVYALERKADEYAANPQGLDQAKRLRNIVSMVDESWGRDSVVPSKQVREFVTKIQNVAHKGTEDPTAAQAIRRAVAGDLKDVFDMSLTAQAMDHTVTNMAKAWGGGKSAKGITDELTPALKSILAENQKIHALSLIRDAAEFAAKREASGSTRMKGIVSKGLDLGLLGTGNITGLGAKKALEVALPRLDNAASAAAYKLVEAAKAGKPLAAVTKMALQLGLPAEAAQKAVDVFGAKSEVE